MTNGSDELCVFISRLLGDGDVVVMGQPGYRMDEIVSVGAGAGVRRVPLRDGVHDIEAMVHAAHGARVLWLPNPHNPTGTAVGGARLRALLEGAPDDCLVVFDEAYREFMDAQLRADTVALVHDHPNLVVQRTFSKSAALAGLRVGFAVADPRVASVLEAFRPPFNVNQVALAAVHASLAHTEYAEYTVELIREQRALLEQELNGLGEGYWPSQTNFVTIASGEHSGELHEALAEHVIVVRDGGDLGIPGYVRLSVGAPAQMLIVRQVLRQVFRGGTD
jgi:histidinol-phosphate aminotransferase